MKTFTIKDCVGNSEAVTLQAGNGKSALRAFRRRYCMNTGMYEIHKNKQANCWIMTSSYSSFFSAVEVKP